MTNSVTIDVNNVATTRALNRLQHALGDLSPLFRELSLVLESNLHLRFDMKRDPDGHPWRPWAQSTKAQRTKAGYNERTNLLQLHNPGLRDSFQFKSGRDFVSVASRSAYAGYHEQTTPGTGKLPRRAMMFGANDALGDMDARAIDAASRAFFDHVLNS